MRPINSVFCYLPLDTGAIFVAWLSILVNLVVAVCLLPYIMHPSRLLVDNLIIGLLFSTFFVHTVSSIIAIIGASKKNTRYLLPWLFGQVFEIIILAIIAFYVFLIDLPIFTAAIYVICIFVYIPVHLYLWLCVYSLYYKLVGDRRREEYKHLQQIRKLQIQTMENAAKANI